MRLHILRWIHSVCVWSKLNRLTAVIAAAVCLSAENFVCVCLWYYAEQISLISKACVNEPKCLKQTLKILSGPIYQFQAEKLDCNRHGLYIHQGFSSCKMVIMHIIKTLFAGFKCIFISPLTHFSHWTLNMQSVARECECLPWTELFWNGDFQKL